MLLKVVVAISYLKYEHRLLQKQKHHEFNQDLQQPPPPLSPPSQVILKNGNRVPYGLCFWAGGTEPRPLTKRLIEAIGPEQTETEGSKRGQITVDG